MRLPLQAYLERALYIVLFLLVLLNIVFLFQIQDLIQVNQQNTLEARQANIERQSKMEGYIKCIILLRYDNPNLNPQSSREEVEMALDRCASLEN